MSPGRNAASIRAALRGAVPAHVTARDMIRRHCREHGKQLACLACLGLPGIQRLARVWPNVPSPAAASG